MQLPKWVLLMGAAMIVLSGCRSAVPPALYTLSPILQPADETVSGSERGKIVGILPVVLPGTIDRIAMVSRNGTHRLTVSGHHRWANYPDQLIQQVLETNVQALLPGARVISAPWPLGVKPGVTVTVQFYELIGTVNDKVTLNVRWIVAGNDPAATAFHRLRTVEPVSGRGYDEFVNAYNRLLATLCRDMADSLKTFCE